MVDLTQLASFALAVFLLVISPGPNGVLIAKTVPTSGRMAGFANIAGFITAFYVHGTLAIFGISLILVHSAQAFLAFKLMGAAYLCWIGMKALFSAWKAVPSATAIGPAQNKRNLPTAYAEGFLTNALNPKVSMFYLAVFPQFIPHGANGAAELGTAYSLVLVHSLINMMWFGAVILLFHRLGQAAASPSLQRWVKGVTGAVFIGFGLKIATLRAS